MLVHTNFCDNAIFFDYFLDIYYLMDQVLSYDPILAVFFFPTLLAVIFFILFIFNSNLMTAATRILTT